MPSLTISMLDSTRSLMVNTRDIKPNINTDGPLRCRHNMYMNSKQCTHHRLTSGPGHAKVTSVPHHETAWHLGQLGSAPTRYQSACQTSQHDHWPHMTMLLGGSPLGESTAGCLSAAAAIEKPDSATSVSPLQHLTAAATQR